MENSNNLFKFISISWIIWTFFFAIFLFINYEKTNNLITYLSLIIFFISFSSLIILTHKLFKIKEFYTDTLKKDLKTQSFINSCFKTNNNFRFHITKEQLHKILKDSYNKAQFKYKDF